MFGKSTGAWAAAGACCLSMLTPSVAAVEIAPGWSIEGWTGMEARLFPRSPLDPAQAHHSAAWVATPSIKGRWGAEESWEMVLTPYARLDARDAVSRYTDLREAVLKYRDSNTHVRVGMDTVFWGVMESNHLIDVINQVDPRADVDLEAKLGQPMVSYTRFLDQWGRVEVFWLPYFRARPGLGVRSRQRMDAVSMSSSAAHGLGSFRRHHDWAVRWSGQVGDLDMGFYHFRGLSREPDDGVNTADAYRDMIQNGVNLQLPQGNMMWKLEALRRSGQGAPFVAWSMGGEYTLSRSSGDWGLLMEWSRDLRDARAPSTRFSNALFGGVRYRLNESGDSELLCGALRDRTHQATMYKCEFNRRVADHLSLGLIARQTSAPASSVYAPLRRDENLQISLKFNF